MITVEIIRGLIRPFITFCLVGTAVALFLVGKIEAKELIPIISLIIGFYFGERSALKKPQD